MTSVVYRFYLSSIKDLFLHRVIVQFIFVCLDIVRSECLLREPCSLPVLSWRSSLQLRFSFADPNSGSIF
jgi:hypothetical protein